MSNVKINIQMTDDLKQPYEAFDVETPNETTRKAIENARNGIGLSKGFSSIDALMKALNTDN